MLPWWIHAAGPSPLILSRRLAQPSSTRAPRWHGMFKPPALCHFNMRLALVCRAACAALACCCLCSTGMLLLVQHRNAPEHLCSTGLLVSLTWCILAVGTEHRHAAGYAA